MKKLLFFVLAFTFAISLTGVALAQAPIPDVPPSGILPFELDVDAFGKQGPITDQGSLVTTIMRLIQWFAWIIGLAAVVMGLYAGILFITAAGDSGKIETARDILLYAVIGIVVAIVAFGLVAISTAIIGV